MRFLVGLLFVAAGYWCAVPFEGSVYLGQQPPGEIPVVFGPGRISLDTRLETYPSFAPDLKTMFFSVVNADWSQGQILWTRLEHGAWSTPERVPFSDPRFIDWESSISPDGKKIFFASNRPPSGGMDIWMTQRTSANAWSEPVRLPAPVNSASEDGTPCVTANGTLYFKSRRPGGLNGSWLYRAPLKDGGYPQVESLGGIIPTGPGETEPFVSPDESYLIITSQTLRGGRGGWDLGICFHRRDGSWTAPVPLGPEINTDADEYGARVSPDGKYLFFTREKRGTTMDIYWVDAAVLDRLRAGRT